MSTLPGSRLVERISEDILELSPLFQHLKVPQLIGKEEAIEEIIRLSLLERAYQSGREYILSHKQYPEENERYLVVSKTRQKYGVPFSPEEITKLRNSNSENSSYELKLTLACFLEEVYAKDSNKDVVNRYLGEIKEKLQEDRKKKG